MPNYCIIMVNWICYIRIIIFTESFTFSDLYGLKALFLAGERADPDTVLWAQEHLKKPVIDHYWQTESGWPISSNFLGSLSKPLKVGSSSLPVCYFLGFNISNPHK